MTVVQVTVDQDVGPLVEIDPYHPVAEVAATTPLVRMIAATEVTIGATVIDRDLQTTVIGK